MIFKLGISTCPNDTYIFGGILTNKIETDFKFQTVLDDVEVLNGFAIQGKLDIIKVSYGVVDKVLDKYLILNAGGALGFGCGPLVVSKNYNNMKNMKKIGIPGKNTSAFKIFKYFFGEDFEFVGLRFDKIMPMISEGKLDGGIVIHEGRFVYKNLNLNLNLIADLGELWENKFNAPIPLGAILIKKDLAEYAKQINNLIVKSIDYAANNYEELYPFIKKYAQEIDDKVIKQHIELFVNKYSYDLTEAKPSLIRFLKCTEKSFI